MGIGRSLTSSFESYSTCSHKQVLITRLPCNTSSQRKGKINSWHGCQVGRDGCCGNLLRDAFALIDMHGLCTFLVPSHLTSPDRTLPRMHQGSQAYCHWPQIFPSACLAMSHVGNKKWFVYPLPRSVLSFFSLTSHPQTELYQRQTGGHQLFCEPV